VRTFSGKEICRKTTQKGFEFTWLLVLSSAYPEVLSSFTCLGGLKSYFHNFCKPLAGQKTLKQSSVFNKIQIVLRCLSGDIKTGPKCSQTSFVCLNYLKGHKDNKLRYESILRRFHSGVVSQVLPFCTERGKERRRRLTPAFFSHWVSFFSEKITELKQRRFPWQRLCALPLIFSLCLHFLLRLKCHKTFQK
jgi:hypothetical protein